jgi:hypothetical protein
MSINDLLEQGIGIQGQYDIEVWDNEKEEYTNFTSGQYFEFDRDEIEEEYLNAEIFYMYAKDGVLVIEVEPKKE